MTMPTPHVITIYHTRETHVTQHQICDHQPQTGDYDTTHVTIEEGVCMCGHNNAHVTTGVVLWWSRDHLVTTLRVVLSRVLCRGGHVCSAVVVTCEVLLSRVYSVLVMRAA